MEQAELQELESKLAVLDASGAIYQAIAGLAGKVGELETETCLLAEAIAKFYDLLKDLAVVSAQQQAQMKAQHEGLVKRKKPEPDPEPPAGGKVN